MTGKKIADKNPKKPNVIARIITPVSGWTNLSKEVIISNLLILFSVLKLDFILISTSSFKVFSSFSPLGLFSSIFNGSFFNSEFFSNL